MHNRYLVNTFKYSEKPDDIEFENTQFELINQRLIQYTYPNYYKQLVNKDHDVYPHGKYMEEWYCESCGKIFLDTPQRITSLHKPCLCDKCYKKTWSYPEKFVYYLLDQAKIKFKIHKKFDWSDKREYDFYLFDYKYIIETHGIQHY